MFKPLEYCKTVNLEIFLAVVRYNGAEFISISLTVVKTFQCCASGSVSHCVVLVSFSAFSLPVVKHFGVSTLRYVS